LACNPEIIFDPSIPPCLKNVITSVTPPKTIQSQIIDQEQHYWINTDKSHSDGVEYIVNNQCDTICYICGECFLPDCASQYNSKKWITIWEQ
jgi:hypothetical protein